MDDDLKPFKPTQKSNKKPRDTARGGRGKPRGGKVGRGGGGERGGRPPLDRITGRDTEVNDLVGVLTGKPPTALFTHPHNPDLMTFAQVPAVFRKLVGQKASPLTDESAGLRVAAKMGSLESVKLFVDHGANPAAYDNEAIFWAAENGYADIVKYLILQPTTNPAALGNRALKAAQRYKHTEVIAVLETDPRVTGRDDFEQEALDILYPLQHTGGAYSKITITPTTVTKKVVATDVEDEPLENGAPLSGAKRLEDAAAREARLQTLARTTYPFIPEVLSVDGTSITMTRAPGIPLSAALGLGLDPRVVAPAVEKAAHGIAASHLRHRDFSPHNLNYYNGEVWVMDFGLADIEEGPIEELAQSDLDTYEDTLNDGMLL